MTTATATKKRVYLFNEGTGSMRDLLGGKGAGLAEMIRQGFPVPPGFTITTETCNEYYALGKKFPEKLLDDIKEKLTEVEKVMGKKFGGHENPLLVSVRSGAKFSMPGMMDTILNLGLNDETLNGLIKLTGNERFVLDSYRRFIQMYSGVVMGLEKNHFEKILKNMKQEKGVKEDTDLNAEDLKKLIVLYKTEYKKLKGTDFPSDVHEQLIGAIKAVFESWNSERAIVYREKENIPHNLGTAVNVQSMVFGNMGDDSGTGVAFTRDNSTGENKITGDFLFNAQGEDVVAGIRTPLSIAALNDKNPQIYNNFVEIAHKLEKHYKDVQDMEFTMEKGKLFMLQTRSAKRTAIAAVKIAVDMVAEGLIDKETAVMRVSPDQVDQLLHPYFLVQDKLTAIDEGKFIAKGIMASPGAATGIIVFTSEDAIRMKGEGKNIILTRPETTPDDAPGMNASVGILTSTGGPTSHAALVARQWGIPCVVGCEAITIDVEKKTMTAGKKIFTEGDIISIDGGTGEIFEGDIPKVVPTELPENGKKVLEWADEIRDLGVYANADNARDAKRARDYGAEGIGLCRTEHMFMESDRLPVVQKMIMLAPDAESQKRAVDRLKHEIIELDGEKKSRAVERLRLLEKDLEGDWKEYTECLAKLLPIQRGDFYGILKAMEGRWVIIRLLDPPLHEFLPNRDEIFEEVIKLRITGENNERLKEKEALLQKIEKLHEFNPMLGLRVCRLGIVYPEMYKMQVRAIIEAACALTAEKVDARVEIMLPGVGHINEMKVLRVMVDEIAEEVMKEKGVRVTYKVGTMIELPRACTEAGKLATVAQFFSFGTNDLTQTTFGYSRDDAAGTFIPVYLEKGILEKDPFQVLDREGVGRLMRMAVEEGRKANPELELGICGEHGGEPASVEFCHILGLSYVSCSPFRVPIARLAAAQAKMKNKK